MKFFLLILMGSSSSVAVADLSRCYRLYQQSSGSVIFYSDESHYRCIDDQSKIVTMQKSFSVCVHYPKQSVVESILDVAASGGTTFCSKIILRPEDLESPETIAAMQEISKSMVRPLEHPEIQEKLNFLAKYLSSGKVKIADDYLKTLLAIRPNIEKAN